MERLYIGAEMLHFVQDDTVVSLPNSNQAVGSPPFCTAKAISYSPMIGLSAPASTRPSGFRNVKRASLGSGICL